MSYDVAFDSCTLAVLHGSSAPSLFQSSSGRGGLLLGIPWAEPLRLHRTCGRTAPVGGGTKGIASTVQKRSELILSFSPAWVTRLRAREICCRDRPSFNPMGPAQPGRGRGCRSTVESHAGGAGGRSSKRAERREWTSPGSQHVPRAVFESAFVVFLYCLDCVKIVFGCFWQYLDGMKSCLEHFWVPVFVRSRKAAFLEALRRITGPRGKRRV